MLEENLPSFMYVSYFDKSSVELGRAKGLNVVQMYSRPVPWLYPGHRFTAQIRQ